MEKNNKRQLTTKIRLELFRKTLKKHEFNGYIVPTTDEYLSEYAPAYAKRLEYITGFTGSNGVAVILQDIVLFFTDGRYLNQSSKQLDQEIFKIFDIQTIESFNWNEYTNSKDIIAYDTKLFTNLSVQKFSSLNLKSYKNNLIDEIWMDKPEKPNSTINDYPVEYAGEDYKSKISKCRKFLSQHNANALVITDAPSLCWLLNLRAHDTEFAPLLLANCIITKEEIYLFTNKNRLDKSFSREELVVVVEKDFEKIINSIKGKILLDEFESSIYISNFVKERDYKNIKNPCILWKARKNEKEIYYAKEAHIQDAVAVCEMLAFIDKNDVSSLSEYDIGVKLNNMRSQRKNYVFDSFPAICGYQSNGAVIHYKAEKDSAKKISDSGILLIDSGGQYIGATTDITRTISIGAPSLEEKKYYTKVLKGHIALSQAVFPKNKVTGAHLDILARQYLWSDGKDYAHGTGHGVGSFLNVHEGPQNISLFSFNYNIEKGMIISNEPGYYEDGKFGIRIENLMYVDDYDDKYLRFKQLTLVPYCKELIDTEELTSKEIEYIKSYYSEIKEKILPLLSKDAKNWFKKQLI